MGNASQTKEAKILMIGLDGAGKTTALYKLKDGEVSDTIEPTNGFNVETVKNIRGVNFLVWDIGGQDRIRRKWGNYCGGTDAIIFVVDSNDRERIEEASIELNKILNEYELKNIALLILANKKDYPNAMTVSEITEKLNLHSYSREWHIQSTCATTGDGLYQGIDWIAQIINR